MFETGPIRGAQQSDEREGSFQELHGFGGIF